MRRYHDQLKPTPASQEDAFSETVASNPQDEFYLLCQRDLRANVARMRLYIEDDRAGGTLLGHAMDRIVNEHADFRDVVMGMYKRHLSDVLLNTGGLREKL